MMLNRLLIKLNNTEIINMKNVTAGIVAGIFGCTGSAILIINAAQNLGLNNIETSSWLFGIYFFGGLIGVMLSTKYKIPISGAYTITGSVMLLNNVAKYNINEFAGAFLVSGLIILFIGVTGLKSKILKYIPLPIIMAMIGGTLTRFAIVMVDSIKEFPLLGLAVLIAFLVSSRIFKRIPPVLLALIVGVIVSIFTKSIYLSDINVKFLFPAIVIPKPNMDAFLGISIPLSLLIIGAENTQAIGVLISQGYSPPIDAMTIASGLGGIAASFFGGHAANIAGPMTAICSSSEAGNSHDDRYKASIVNGIIFIIFGIFSSVTLSYVTAFPKTLINMIAGLSMIGVLKISYKEAFSSGKFNNGAFFSFIVALSNVQIFNISAPIWALLVGLIVSLITEHNDFSYMINNNSHNI